MHLAPPPNSRDLLPPLLACLPTSFAAPRPPPVLLPLLSPLLRQRVNYLAGDSAGSDGWLPLLSWDSQRAKKLPSVVERMDLEPHPVSGELELEETNTAKYRRLDQETLQARIEVEQFGLLPIFVWCEKDERGGEEAGWKLFELRTLDDLEDGTEWFDSPSEANEAGSSRSIAVPSANEATQKAEQEEDDDDDYWDSYNKTPASRTPANRSPAPNSSSILQMTNRSQTQDRSERDYYERYGSEVQPAMDPHDPDEDMGDQGGSLRGDSLLQQPQTSTSNGIADQADYLSSLQPHAGWKQPHDSAVHTGRERSLDGEHDISMPRPISPTSSHSSIDKLEERAAEMSSTGDSDTAQLAIKQHISTDVKSLFRLAKASGMSRQEFTRIVRTELDVLSLLEQDE
ncbi:hypothetical protein M409DRAFT_20267 [Zasmidium cellare ATCC 36951]|uniref:Uncharacterized protein n=1 Tax=Zasmidium cellare ATCC 36951 TaxID=1080233 RepID=A0A6A6CT21_ZASCE|nr:uncharacterized protein M409DRAFT_20267 [Zasmidium cellare ATCC 36951]KAF2169853.1 hypothetical protein M409DRAFT_20267 [Zasmidium cellare ATCC 36951]